MPHTRSNTRPHTRPYTRPVAVAVLTAAVLAVSVAAPGGSVAAQAPAVVGSANGPDPYFPRDGNGGYQVTHYTVDDRYRPGTDALSGRTTLAAVAGSSSLSAFHLDLRLVPDAVSVNGRPARFSKPSPHELKVVPRSPLAAGKRFTVTVRYHGTPSRLGTGTAWDGWFHEPGEVAAVGEPQIGPLWFAANETPSDKATYDVVVRVPRGQQVVSGGRLVSRKVGRSWTAWHWKVAQPISTYLAYFVAGRFEIRRGSADGRPLVYAVSRKLDASQRDRSFALMGNTPRVLRWMEARFGPYPFTEAGGVMGSVYTGFALENASRPFYPWVGGPGPLNLVVHELAHQWFGDAVALQRWKDTWLNEGFATYAEWLWEDGHGGRSVQQALSATYDTYPSASAFWSLKVSDPGPADIFSSPIYDRGGMMLAALRCRLGAAGMSDLVRTWVDQHRTGTGSGTGTGAQFRALAVSRGGAGLTGFFRTWLDEPAKPEPTQANGLSGCA